MQCRVIIGWQLAKVTPQSQSSVPGTAWPLTMYVHNTNSSNPREDHLPTILERYFVSYTVEPLLTDILYSGHLVKSDKICGPD